MKITIFGISINIADNLIRFAIVGGLGTITNLLVFFVTADIWDWEANFCSIIAFMIAVTQNYIINHKWSFKNDVDYGLNFRSYLEYIIVNILGLIANLIVLNIILIFLQPDLKVIAQFFGILVGFIFDYIGSKIFVFKKHGGEKNEK